MLYTGLPHVPFALVADHQSLRGRHHARTIEEALAKVILGEGEFKAGCHSFAFNIKGKCWPVFYLMKRNKSEKDNREREFKHRCSSGTVQ